MNLPKLSPVIEGTRWPSGEGIDLALLCLTPEELALRTGFPLAQGVEPGLGRWSSVGGYLASGVAVEFIYYAQKPPPAGVIVRVDKGASYPAAFDEALAVVGLSREDAIYVSPIADA